MQPVPTQQAASLVVHSAGPVTVYTNPDCSEDVDAEALIGLPAALCALTGRSTRQRNRATWWELPSDESATASLVVRLYAHGGVLGRVLGTAFLGASRMLNELRIHICASRAGVPTSVPVALRVERRGPFVTAHYVTRKLPDALNLLDFCEGPGAQRDLSPPQRQRLASAVAGAVARMHDAGILHADLNLKNLLVRDPCGNPKVFIIDFDKARMGAAPALKKRLDNLLRLDRSVYKWAASRRIVGPLDRLRVLHSYLSRYPAWRAAAGDVARGYHGTPLRHRLLSEADHDAPSPDERS